MKKVISIILVLFSTSALAQINLPKIPKIPNPFKKNGLASEAHLSVKWSCPQESYKQIAQLPQEADVSITIGEDGQVIYHPNIFKIKPLSKQFFQGLNPLGRKKGTYKVDYEDCLDRFYSDVSKAHNEYKKHCSTVDKLCEYENRFLVQTSKKAVEDSQYFKKKDNLIIVPSLLPGSDVYKLTEDEAAVELTKFCNENEGGDTGKLFSQSVIDTVKKNIDRFRSKLPGLVCMEKYRTALSAEIKRIQEEHCEEGAKGPVCSKAESNVSELEKKISEIVELKKAVVLREEKNFEQRYGKTVDGKIVDDYFKNTFKIPEENCGYSNHHVIDKGYVDLSKYDREISDNLDKILSEGSSDCQKQFLQNYIASKSHMLNSDETFREFCTLNSTKFCEAFIGEQEIVKSNIEKMIKGIYGELGERYYREQVACVDEAEMGLVDILDKVKDSQKVIRCMDIKEGDFANISQRMNLEVQTGNYTLKNKGNKKFDAYFNIEFQDNPAAKTTAKELMARAQSCMADVSPFLKGPNGEQITIKIVNQENGLNDIPVQQRPRKTSIGIAQSGFRSHSRMYDENIDCPVITHEVLHLFGLCDEYQEKWKGDGQNYNCRTVPKAVSVMKNQYDMFAIAVDKAVSCECEGKTCRDIMEGSDEDKRKLYLGRNAFDVIDYQARSEYCSYTNLPNKKYKDLDAKGENIIVSKSTENSIVVESRDFAYNGNDSVTRTSFSCKCETGDERCLEFLENTKDIVEIASNEVRSSCPSGARHVGSGIGNAEKSNFDYNPASGIISITQKARAPSLLHPSHVERILGGACEEKGKKYLECAKFAYVNGECDVPDYCKNDSDYLGIKQ